MDDAPAEAPSERSRRAPVVVSEHAAYGEARAAVEQLVRAGVPASAISIAWSRLRQVEPAAPRRRDGGPAFEGALAGALFGGAAAVLLTSFHPLAVGVSPLTAVATWTVVFAVLGSLWRLAASWLRRDRRFVPGAELAAEGYQLWVDEDQAEASVAVLDPVAPPPSATTSASAPARTDRPAAVHRTATSLLGGRAGSSAAAPSAATPPSAGVGTSPSVGTAARSPLPEAPGATSR